VTQFHARYINETLLSIATSANNPSPIIQQGHIHLLPHRYPGSR